MSVIAYFVSIVSLDARYGLGVAKMGATDLLWPGGVRNWFYQVTSFSPKHGVQLWQD